MQRGQQLLTVIQLFKQSPQKVFEQHDNVDGFSSSPRQIIQSILFEE
jgi:hypothetical protein